MRLAAASLLAASALLGLGVAGAASSPAEKRYVQVDVRTWFEYQVDRGRDGAIMGKYSFLAFYNLHTIAVFDGSRVTTPGMSVVGGGITITDDRTKNVLVNGKWEEVPYCEGWEPGVSSAEGTDGYVVSPGAAVSIGSTARLNVKAGSAMSIKIDPKPCNEVENLHRHGLTPGPSFAMPAPAKARFRGTASFSLTCVDRASHGYEQHGVDSFSGYVHYSVRITPFPADRLKARQSALRGLIDDAPTPLSPGTARGKACL